jgi:hypothetical protein
MLSFATEESATGPEHTRRDHSQRAAETIVMKKRTAWIVSMLIAGSAALAADSASAQVPGAVNRGGYAEPMMAPGMDPMMGNPGLPPRMMGQGPPPGMMGPMGPQSFGPQMGPGMPNPYAPPMYAAAPIGYQSAPPPEPTAFPMGAPDGYGYGDGMYEGDGSGGCYGDGCNSCGPRHPLASHALGIIRHVLPYDDGGCCAPHWFDAHVEYVNLRREDVSRTVNFMSDTPLGPIVLSTNDLDFNSASGFRTTLTRQIGPGSNLELTYLGQHNWTSFASVSSPTNSLFSAYSQFGLFPLAGQGFTETDQASFASIAYSSDIDNLELNYRQRWQGYGCKIQGSWLTGARFFALNEDLLFSTVSQLNNASSLTSVSTYNSLVGGQFGGDLWICIIPGLSIGAEGKAGVYINHAYQNTNIQGTTLVLPLNERVDSHDAAFIGEASLMANWRLTQSWTVRGGYNFIYVDGVALAPENFNAAPPFLVNAFQNPPRVPTITNDGNIFLHGFSIGFEYMW